MKINGRRFDEPAVVTIDVNVGDEIISLRAQAVLDYSEFEALCPVPKPPEVIRPGGKKATNPEDPKYKAKLMEWSQNRAYYMMLKSLSATEGLEWDKVQMDDPKTWSLMDEELNKAFTPYGASRVAQGVLRANCLDDQMLKEARSSFLPSAQQESSQ